MAMEIQCQNASAQLEKIEGRQLSILRLAEPIASAPVGEATKRSSDISNNAGDNPSPASLADDLGHYKELFSKLRFSYIEQVTKEKFLRAIVGEPPQIVEPQENVELERRLIEEKGELKAQKLAVAEVVANLEKFGQQISERHERVEIQRAQLHNIPVENESLNKEIARLRAQRPSSSTNPSLGLPLQATQNIVAERQSELEKLERKLRSLQQSLPRKTGELERLENELRPLELQRAGTIAAAQEARKRREEGEQGRGDDLELKGRWYRNVDVVLRDILEIDA